MKVSLIVAGAVGLILGLLIDHALFWRDDRLALLFVILCGTLAVVLTYLALHSRVLPHHVWLANTKK